MKYLSQYIRRRETIATLATMPFVFASALIAQSPQPAHHIAHPPRSVPAGSIPSAVSSRSAAPQVAAPSLSPTTWTNIGPTPVNADPASEATPDNGRVNGIAPDPTDPNTIYVAASGGGVWKTINGGAHWAPLTDTQKTLSMGAIAIARSNPRVLYAGTGEPNSGGNYGRGVLVSTNSGASWTLRNNGGLFDRLEISEIAVDPTNASVAYVATSSCCGTNTDSSKDDGIWKTTDSGATWTNTTEFLNPVVSNGLTSVKIDPNNPSIVYAAAGYPFGVSGNGVYKSTNAGASWTLLTNAPKGAATGVIKIALSKANSKVIYIAATGSGKSGSTPDALYKFVRSNDSGATFTDLTSGTPNYMSRQGNFDTTLIADPANAAIVYAGGDSGRNAILRSTDSGAHWSDIHGTSANGANGPHVDHHSSAFDANGKFLDGDDGGLFRYDPASNPVWTSLNGDMSTILLEGLGVSFIDPTLAVGGTQDNGAVRYSGSLGWDEVTCGDAGRARFSPQNASRVYVQCPSSGSFFERSDDGGQTWSVKVDGITDDTNAQNFYAPFAVDPKNGDRVVYGAQHVFETRDAGDTWTQLGSFTFPANIDSIDISASHPKTIYASAGGKTFVTEDNGSIWVERDLPVSGNVSDLHIFPGHHLSAVAVVGSFTGGGTVFHTTDGGKKWIDISGNLPSLSSGTLPTWSAKFHGNSLNTIYVGNDDGVYKTSDRGKTWFRFGAGMPDVQVIDLQLDTTAGLLAAGTYGRGAWEIQLPPDTKTTVSAVSGKASQLVTLKADVKPSGVPGAITFFVDGAAIPGTATYDASTGHAEQPYIITVAVGTHVITADFVSANDSLGGDSGGVNDLTVK